MDIENDNKSSEVTLKKNGSTQASDSEQKYAQVRSEKFDTVYSRLNLGCGRERCRSEACLSNPINKALVGKNPEQITKKAEELIRAQLDKLKLCSLPDKKPVKALQKQELQQILSLKDPISLAKSLNSRIQQVFNDPDALVASFFSDSNVQLPFNAQTGCIDIDSIRLLVNYIQSLKDSNQSQAIKEIISSAFIKHLTNVVLHSDYLKYFSHIEDLRIFAILFNLLSLYGQDLSLFSKIKRSLVFLTDEQTEALARWLVPLTLNELEGLKQSIQTNIMVWLIQSQEKLGSRLEDIEAGMNVLKVVYQSNLLHSRLTRESFIISIFDRANEEQINPIQEYTSWLKGKNNKNPDKRYFSFCKYPFSMSLAFKNQILEINSKFQQKNQHSKLIDSFLNQGMFFINQEQLFLKFEVSRENILQDTLNAISVPGVNFQLPFKVKFKGEQGIDEGGLRKEYYQIMIKQLFNPDFGLFKEKQNKQFNWFNGDSLDMPMLYELIGALMGIAIFNQIQMDVRFPAVIYKKLIGDPVSLEDIKQFDSATYNGLNFILSYEGDIENDLQETFAIEYESFGEFIQYELKPGGDSISVNNENKSEYVELYVDWLLNKSIEKQFNNFKRGFFKVLDKEIIKFFTFDELVLILTGLEEINMEELKASTKYDQGYTKDSPQVQWLWEILEEYPLEKRKKFLFFSTGSDRSPVGGLADLDFVIARHGDSDHQLPSAHTCFNHLLLPAYSSKEILRQKLNLSLENAEGFGLF